MPDPLFNVTLTLYIHDFSEAEEKPQTAMAAFWLHVFTEKNDDRLLALSNDYWAYPVADRADFSALQLLNGLRSFFAEVAAKIDGLGYNRQEAPESDSLICSGRWGPLTAQDLLTITALISPLVAESQCRWQAAFLAGLSRCEPAAMPKSRLENRP